MGGAWFFTGDGLLLLLTIVGAMRLFGRSGACWLPSFHLASLASGFLGFWLVTRHCSPI